MDSTSKAILTSVLSLPTMSFHEAAVATFVRFYAAGLGLEVEEDRAGNLLVQYRRLSGSRAPKRAVTFAAHMDHPGFEAIASKGKTATVALWGKVNPKTFAGSKVIAYTADGPAKGRIGRKILSKKHLGQFCFALDADAKVAKGDFGHYDLPHVRMEGDRIWALAADNLASVAAILDLFTRLVKSRPEADVSGLFTRGEEAGFLGAFAAMESGLIPKRDPLIVLECSSAAAGGGVTIGGGPALRAGDLQSTFDPAVDVWMSDVASSLACPERSRRVPRRSFQYQRALLQGGRCEACVYIAEGYRTGGIALPLGNYHNQGPKGYAAEYISARDYMNLLQLIEALAHNPMPPGTLRRKVSPIQKHYRGLKRKFLTSK